MGANYYRVGYLQYQMCLISNEYISELKIGTITMAQPGEPYPTQSFFTDHFLINSMSNAFTLQRSK